MKKELDASRSEKDELGKQLDAIQEEIEEEDKKIDALYTEKRNCKENFWKEKYMHK